MAPPSYRYTLFEAPSKTSRHIFPQASFYRATLRSLVFLAIAVFLYLFLAPSLSSLASLPGRSPGRTGKLRVAIFDSFWEHYEVIGPLIYSLSRIPDLDLTVYRTYFHYGYPDLLAPYYTGSYRKAEDFFTSSPNVTTAHNVDVLFLPNADRDIRKILEEGAALEQHPNLRKAKIIAGVHRTDQWLPLTEKPDKSPLDWMNTPAGQTAMEAAWSSGRLSFFTLSSHVKRNLKKGLSNSPFKRNPRIETFIPVFPNIARSAGKTGPARCMHAAIQGTFNGDRDYDRIFADLEAELRAKPSEWGYRLIKDEAGQDRLLTKEDEEGGENAFKLHLLGHIKHYDKVATGSELLRDIVQVHTNLQYKEYYSKLSEMDLLLPAWKSDSLYLDSRASSSIPAAIMSRIPTLLSPNERAAYEYARGPAFLERQEYESEIQAIGRLRREGKCSRASTQEWEEYERELMDHNKAVLLRLLYR